MWTCQYAVTLLGEKISTKPCPIVAQTKQRNPLFNTKVKTINSTYTIQITGLFLALFIYYALFFYLCDIYCMGLIECVTQRHCFRDWWIFESKRSMNSLPCVLILQHKQHVYLTVYTGSPWLDLSQGSVARKIWLFALNSNASLSLVLFMPVEFCIEDWNLPLSSVPCLSYSSGSPVVSPK